MLAPTPASPESAGMSKAALDRLENHLKQRYVDAGRFPGTQRTSKLPEPSPADNRTGRLQGAQTHGSFGASGY